MILKKGNIYFFSLIAACMMKACVVKCACGEVLVW
jgi:hypothetical protein